MFLIKRMKLERKGQRKKKLYDSLILKKRRMNAKKMEKQKTRKIEINKNVEEQRIKSNRKRG